MKLSRLIPRALLMTALALASCPPSASARGYSSGSHSYSSHSSSSGSHSFSSHSSSSGFSSHSFSSGSSSSSSGSHNFSSGSGRSYSSGSSHDDSSRHSYSSGRSYSSGSSLFSSGSTHSSSSSSGASRATKSASDDFHFDTAAARARKEETSKDTFTQYKESTAPKPPPINFNSQGATRVNTSDGGYSPPRSTTTYNSYHRTVVYVPDAVTLSTRSLRMGTFFQPYYSRPIVLYNDPYSSLFWWWLLDQSADQRALWAYHHRADMDAARYQALLAQDADLESRVQQLEAQQVAADPNFVPAGLDRDLMYTDDHVQRAYDTRATASGRLMFWIFGLILVGSFTYVFVYLVFFKRWHVFPQPST